MSSPFNVSEFQVEAQDYINGRQVASNYYQRSTLLSVMKALALGNQDKTSLTIGRPNGSVVLGQTMSALDALAIGRRNTYKPRIQQFTTNNSRNRSANGFDDSPAVANRDTNAHSSATLAAAAFNWTAKDTPIWIWTEHKIRAQQEGTTDGMGVAMQQLIQEATEVAYQDMNDSMIAEIWAGNPSSQTVDLWSQQLGMAQVCSQTNTYGKVDRTATGASQWQSNVDSTTTAVDYKKIANRARYFYGLNVTGSRPAGGYYLALMNQTLFLTIKDQIKAARLETVDVSNKLPDRFRQGAEYELQQYEDVLFGYEPYLDTGYANSVFFIDPSVFKFILHEQFNFQVTPFKDQSEIYQGAYADYAQAQARYIFSCDNPKRTVLFNAIGT